MKIEILNIIRLIRSLQKQEQYINIYNYSFKLIIKIWKVYKFYEKYYGKIYLVTILKIKWIKYIIMKYIIIMNII